MTTDRARSIATMIAGVVSMAVLYRVLIGLTKHFIAIPTANGWLKYVHPHLPAESNISVMLLNIIVHIFTAVPGAFIVTIFARILFKRSILPIAALAALLVLVLDKNVHYLLQNQYSEQVSVLLVSSLIAPFILMAFAFLTDIGKTPNQAL